MAAALLLALAGCSGSLAPAAVAPPTAGSTFTLMQMNECLSGLAGCFVKVDYPAGVEEAVTRIGDTHPDAVTVNETCSHDAVLVAGRTGYHLRFSKVLYHRRPLRCIKPGGRGLFGDAVLTKAAIERDDSAPFAVQAGPERRQWLCVLTQSAVEICTAHLASPERAEVAANGPQCDELRVLLARRAITHTVIFGGDVNRRFSCAPDGFWTRTDASARRDPGSQHVYGGGVFRSPSAWVARAAHTDHDVLFVRARRAW